MKHRAGALTLMTHLLPGLRELYAHAGFDPDLLTGNPIGAVEYQIGKLYRATPTSDPTWRRKWAAWSATRAMRKGLLPREQQESYVAEWIEWGMAQ